MNGRVSKLSRIGSLAIVAGGGGVAEAHPSGYRAGDAWWQAWHVDGLVVFVLGLLAAWFGTGLYRLWRRAGVGRGIPVWRAAALAAGLAAVCLALLSPLDVLSDDLSWVHMTQHMVLMAVAAPLMVLGAPGLAAVWALPRRWRSLVGDWPQWNRVAGELWRASWNPWWIWLLHAVVLWGWHLPVLYQWALVDPLVHDIEHLSFFLTACLFWRIAIDHRRHLRLNPGLGVLYLFTTSLHAMVLGIFMTLAPQHWYPIYEGRTELWNLSPLEDQQLAGAIMWMPACAVYIVVAAGLFASWIQGLERAGRYETVC
ncbi:cytochrome c oxidase assembly protein [Candidatus Laterigemmans baculatus]|uniref:cytochrome c oxidase assembly protein n=1 Tax=Candidatus Laterigemmans baculatus TaxID=2770505 RepID=UPI0013DA1F88|nr:cytochrome c oxidase assembly protein [Candidatus Laterigemmans baculatus]